MKKSVVSALAAAVILGGASVPAFAAQNPFSDVNEHHWAYHSVTELAEAGIVTGYDNSDASLNGRFVGGRNITRYEMAQMIAKTLARIEGESSPFAIQLRVAYVVLLTEQLYRLDLTATIMAITIVAMLLLRKNI